MYPWPFGEFDSVMDDSLNIAMTISFAPSGTGDNSRGVRNRLRLSNLAVRAVQQKADLLKSG